MLVLDRQLNYRDGLMITAEAREMETLLACTLCPGFESLLTGFVVEFATCAIQKGTGNEAIDLIEWRSKRMSTLRLQVRNAMRRCSRASRCCR